MKKYLSIGTDMIEEELFREIQDSSKEGTIKPSGGLWMTEFNPNFTNYNIWIEYLLRVSPYILFYKNRSNNPFKQPCCIVSLKEEAKIYQLLNLEQYNYLLANYNDGNGRISFEKMVNDFDGIFVDLSSLYRNIDRSTLNLFSSFCVNTTLLFNLDCIDYYHSGVVDIEEFDYLYSASSKFVDYEIKYDLEKKFLNSKGKCLVKKK